MQTYQLLRTCIVSLAFCCYAVISKAQKKDAYEMTISGVKVIVQPSRNDIVEIETIIKGGVQNYTENKQGIESLAMTALTECGTAKDDKNSFKNKLDKVSAQMNGTSGMDFASFNLNCIKSDFDIVWPLYVEALTTPAFNTKEFDRIKQDAINNLKVNESQPDNAINKLARLTAFAGKDYAKSPEGTVDVISKLTAAETKAYYLSILTRERMVIVIVGDLDKPVIEQKITMLLSDINSGKPINLKKETYNPIRNSFKSEKKDLATNYLVGITGGPQPGTRDYDAFNLAMQIFYDRDFLEVRTNNGLSYAPYTYFDGELSPYSAIAVSTTDPNKYIQVANNLISKTKRDGFKEEELKDMKTTYLTGFFYKLETNKAQAASLAANQVLHNNWRRALTINEDVKKITVADLNRTFNKYFSKLSWVYQGDPSKVDPALFTSPTGDKMKLPPSKITKPASENR